MSFTDWRRGPALQGLLDVKKDRTAVESARIERAGECVARIVYIIMHIRTYFKTGLIPDKKGEGVHTVRKINAHYKLKLMGNTTYYKKNLLKF